MILESFKEEACFAVQNVRAVSHLVAQIKKEWAGLALSKSDNSPVTVADFAAQAVVGQRLLKEFPEDGFLAEESSAALRDSDGKEVLELLCRFAKPLLNEASPEAVFRAIDHGQMQGASSRFWTMDPIDGTKGFLRGDQYAVALALIVNGDIKVGVLGCPNLTRGRFSEVGGLGSIVLAVRGEGAWVQPLSGEGEWERLQVSTRGRPEDAVILRSFEKQHVDTSRMGMFLAQLGLNRPPVLMDSLAKYAVLAAGEADLLLRFPTEKHTFEFIWDQAPGVIIVEEAGGRVTDLDGKTLNFTAGRKLSWNRGVLITNGRIHSRVLEVLSQMKG